ncbi:ribosomal protein S30-domain-containing protein [Tribonema minus]|uniref:40S ribosomal protein S30 n=1 Tax=Tribonema minus TaxID=303371 RepID=A0A835YXI8_9STRA|nr:ribosomal protein S30-domain-containing protein [Tribonema minus]
MLISLNLSYLLQQVDKQEKKKDPRGRAKKRMQYNRRFVNVVTGVGGKKLGPNSNAAKV